MLFNSLEFILFFSVVLSASLLTRRRKWILLLAASYYFYSCWRFDYLPLLLAATLLNYFCAIGIAAGKRSVTRKAFLWLSLVGSLGILFLFKYFNFIGNLVNGTYFEGYSVIPMLNVALPIGISFYTFQAVGYTIDVYRKRIEPEKHLGYFSLFISFFPQLVAGPIERAEHLLTQLKRGREFDYDRFTSGLMIAGWGFFKKVVIADRLAAYVDAVYNNAHGYYGLPLILSTYFFAFQIYCDFSGYSDIAIGCAKMMGYDLRKNFDTPYFSSSLPEFWRRWHMSLMSWFKDYLYIPLGGSRKGEARKHLNQFVVFVVSGIWHGANLTFVLWGLYHAVLQIISNLTLPFVRRSFGSLRVAPRVARALGVALTFNLVGFGWIFFRANTMKDAWYIISNLPYGLLDFASAVSPVSPREFTLSLLSIAFLLFVEFAQGKESLTRVFERGPALVRYPAYCGLFALILFFGVFKAQPFLYFQF